MRGNDTNEIISNLIDIHTHITPNVDDGSRSMEMSLEMLRSEAEQGGSKIFLTPHSFAFETKRPDSVYAKMRKVQESAAAEAIPLQIYEGCEIYTYRDKMERILQDLKNGRIPSMNGTRYIMAEFDVYEGDMEDAEYCLNRYLEEGWIPIIAHAERYCWTFATVENIRILRELGCLVQVNYYDLDEEPNDDIRSCAQALLRAELVDMMGSDAHRTNHRPPKLTRGARYIRKNCREEYAEDILWRNVEKYLIDKR